MKCFTHTDVDAVGVCRSCGKGVCKACAVDLGQGIACANSCEVNVRDLIVHQAVSRRALTTTPAAYRTQSIVGFLSGGTFLALGGSLMFTPVWPAAVVLALVAAPLLVQGVRGRRTARALEAAMKELPESRQLR
jgi:heme exporter protein D